MRTINAELLKLAIKSGGDDLKKFADSTGVSVSWLQKAVTGNYEHAPRRLVMEAICEQTKISQNKLFPLAATKGKRAS